MRVDVSDLVELDKRLERATRFRRILLLDILSYGIILNIIFPLALFLLVVLSRQLRYAHRWAAWIFSALGIWVILTNLAVVLFFLAFFADLAFFDNKVAYGTKLDMFVFLAPFALLYVACLALFHALAWPVAVGIAAVHQVHRLRFERFDLRLMSSLNGVSGVPTEGKNLIIVAAVNNVLHFRIFGGDGKVMVDTDEKRLAEQARQIKDLRKQLKSLWPPHEMTSSDKSRVITAVTSIVGHTRFESMAIDPLRCIRFRTHGSPSTWSPRKLVMVGLLLGSPILLFLLIISALIQFQPGAWSVLLLVLPAALAYWFWPMARGIQRASAEEARRRDPRPPVLLLRSFRDDVLSLGSPAPRRGRDRPRTFEQVLTGQLWCRGPVIAIGRPGEHIPPMGAARDYYSDAVWQTEAERMVRESQAIVMIVGITPGLGWEMRRVNDLEMLNKLALAFPPVSTDDSPLRWIGFLAQITGLSVTTSLQDVPAEQVLFIVFPPAEEPVFFITRGQRDPRTYLLALAAASQLIPERSIARKDM